MKIKPKTRKTILTTLAIVLIVGLSATTTIFYKKYRTYEYQLQARQQNAVVNLAEYVDKINTDLRKSVYAGTAPMATEISADLRRNCACAKTALAQISAPDTFLTNTYKFLSQVGAVSADLSSKLQTGEEISEQTHNSALSLLKYSESLSEQVDSLISNYDVAENYSVGTKSINTSLSDIEQSFSDYPSLIYDGPFSDHNNQEDAEMLDEFSEISEDEAKKIASNYSGIDQENLLTKDAEVGSFECYVFSTESTTVSITKKGGLLCSILTSNRSGEEKIDPEEAINIGKKYLDSIGYSNMKDTYYASNDGECTINYALEINGVLCYTDMIKVTVAMDDGRVLDVDARSYIMNHQERNISTPTLTQLDAQKLLSDKLTAKDVKVALIPSDNDKEYLCYEFLCKGVYDEDILVYVDAKTGAERQIFLLLHGDGGTLTK